MGLPLADLMDQDACDQRIVEALHPDGLARPRCGGDRLGVRRRHRAPVLDSRCRDCRRVLILRGFAQGATTARMARELGRDRMKLLALCHRLQDNARAGSDSAPLPDPITEADECHGDAGEKVRHTTTRMIRRGPGQQATRARHLR